MEGSRSRPICPSCWSDGHPEAAGRPAALERGGRDAGTQVRQADKAEQSLMRQ